MDDLERFVGQFGLDDTAKEALLQRAEDLVAAFDISLDSAVTAIYSALNIEVQPVNKQYFLVRFKWWERPRWLWSRHATRRAQRQILWEMDDDM